MRNQIYAAEAQAITEAGLNGNSTLEAEEIEIAPATLVAGRW